MFERLDGPLGGDKGLPQRPILPSTIVGGNEIEPLNGDMIPQSQIRLVSRPTDSIVTQPITHEQQNSAHDSAQPEQIIRRSHRDNIGQAPERLIETANYTSLIGDIDDTLDNLQTLGMDIADIIVEHAMSTKIATDRKSVV